MSAILTQRQIICLAVDAEERDEIGIELIQLDTIASQPADSARGFKDAEATSEQLAGDSDDFLPVVEHDDLGERHDT